MGDSDAASSGTGSQDIGDSVLGDEGTCCRHIGDFAPVQETVGVRDMGDTEIAVSADALENDVSHG
jgi:hypothetical protein